MNSPCQVDCSVCTDSRCKFAPKQEVKETGVHISIPVETAPPITMEVDLPRRERVLMTVFNVPDGYEVRIYTLSNCKMVELVKSKEP